MRYLRWFGLLLILAIVSLGQSVFAQVNCSYVVVQTGGYTVAQIDQAFAAADMDPYRMKTLRRTLVFSNGAEVQLLSADEVLNLGCQVNSAVVMDDNVVLDPQRRFEIHSSGVIYESVQAVYKH